MKSSSRRFLWILACLACLLIGFGIYLIQRDLQVLVSQRTRSIEQSLFAAKALLPDELVELSLNSKDSESFERAELSRSLKNLMAELRIDGRLSLGFLEEDSKFRIISSSDPKLSQKMIFELNFSTPDYLPEGQHFSSPLISQEGEHFIYSVLALPEMHKAALLLISNEASLYYQLAGILLHYLTVFGGLLFLTALGVYLLRASFLKKFSRQESLFKSLFEESQQAGLIVSTDAKIVEANPRALEILGQTWDNLIHKKISETPFLVPLETSWADFHQKLEKNQNFQLRMKFISASDRVRYFQFRFIVQTHEFLVLIDDITKKAVLHLEDSSFFDPFTRLPNYQYFQSLMETQKERFSLEKNSMLLIKVYGNASGVSFAKFLKEYFRHTDLILSYEPGLYMVILSGTDLESAYRIAQNLPQQLKEQTQPELTSSQINVGVSQFEKGENYQDWLARAQAALLTASGVGPNRIEAQVANALEILDSPSTSDFA